MRLFLLCHPSPRPPHSLEIWRLLARQAGGCPGPSFPFGSLSCLMGAPPSPPPRGLGTALQFIMASESSMWETGSVRTGPMDAAWLGPGGTCPEGSECHFCPAHLFLERRRCWACLYFMLHQMCFGRAALRGAMRGFKGSGDIL